MSLDPIRNFAKVRVSTTYNSAATSIVLISGDGAKLPGPLTEGAFNLTWFNSTGYPDPSNDPLVEIVRVTSRSGDTLTVVRGQEGTTPSNKNTASVNYLMILAPTKKTMEDIQKFSIVTDQTDFASQSFQNTIKNGNFESWSSGITYAPDGWVAGSGTTMLADSTNKKMGTYGASITSPNGVQGYIYQSTTDLTYYKGRSVTIGGWVKTSTSVRVCLYIQDGISYALSPYHSGSGNWEFLTIPFAVSTSATELTTFCMVYIAGTPVTAYFDGLIFVEGSIVPAFSARPLYDDGKTLTIDSLNNRIGIGTITPSAKLAINGGLNVGSDSDPGDNNLNVDGNIIVGGTVDGVDISLHNIASTGVHGVGADTIDGVSARNAAISTHSSITSSVHGFDSSGNAPAQTHGISRHTGTIGDHTANISNVGSNTHAQIDTAITNSTNHISATTGVHGVSGSVVGTAGTQTFSSKILDNTNTITVTDANFTIQDDLTTTKQAKFQLSGITAINTRTITLQDADITMESTAGSQAKVDVHAGLTATHGATGAVVGTTNAQTLTNKTLTTPTIGDFTNANHTHAAAGVTGGVVDHVNLANKGTNTHAAIDTAIGTTLPNSISNHAGLTTGVHGVTGSVLGTEDMGVANGVASLDANSKVLTSQLPGLALTDVYTVANQAAQIALNATTQEGDVAIRTDENKSYVRNSGGAGTMADWSSLLTPTDVVTSVFSRTGIVTAANNDYTWAQINKATSNIADITTKSHTSLTDIGTHTHAQIDTEIDTNLPGLVTTHNNNTTTAHGVTGAVVGTTNAQTLSGKTLTTPTIGDFTNANHTHAAAGATGGVIDHVNLANKGTNTHTQIDTAITNSISHIAAAAPHSGHDTPTQRDTAISTAVGTHAGLATGVHGVTGYVLGTEDIGIANFVAGLDATGKVPTSQLPALAITSVYTAASQVAQLALTTQEGDVVIRSDENKSYVRNAGSTSSMADFSLLLTPTDAVLSVFGRTGAVVATTNDYTWGQINKATSSIADITTRSHTALTDIGTYNHATIDLHMTSATGVHGVTGVVVGTSDTQTLTNKTLTTPTIGDFTNANHTHAAAGVTGGVVDHVNLANKGTNTHAAIDTAIGTTLPGLVTTHAGLTTAHGSTSAATVSAIMQRDTAGRAQVVAPSAAGDIAIKSTVDTVQANLTTHANGTNTHTQIDTAITNSISHIAAATGIHGVGASTVESVSGSTAKVSAHNAVTGVHGVTGSYILGTEDIGVVNGVAGLDATGKVPTSQLPALAITSVYTAISQAAQLLLATQEGDVVIRSDENKSYVRNAGVTGTMTDYSLLLTPTDAVLSVFGRTGAVAATTNDYTWAQINKATSSIADIATRSHTALTDIGTYNHATIDLHMTSATGVHGVTGVVVGTSDTQTLTNKTLTAPTIIGNATIGDGGTTNYRKIDITGAMTMEGTAQPLAELQYLMGTEGFGVRTPATNGANMATIGDANGEIGACQFADATTKYLDISFKMPGNYEQNTNMYVEFIWRSSVTSGNCYWGVAYSAVAADEAINPALSSFTTGQFLTSSTSNARNNHMITLISPTIDPEDFITLRIERLGADALDTINTAADLIAVNVQFGVNS